ncbi:MAG TPA: methionine biosynthesis protein MetW [Bryobacteraceae bacterium]|nr:methionine biosynthesis protein MetW [Bryobacteraceae bacterium]
MATSLIYRSGAGYELAMMALYGRHYADRYRAIADLIPPGADVLELCCGPGVLYERYLRQKGIRYRGLDMNEKFVKRLAARGIPAECRDLRNERAFPPADYVVMQASLYHFWPDAGPMLDRMLAAARRTVILAEPIRNLACSGLPLVAYLSRKLTDPGSGPQAARLTEKNLDELVGRHGQMLRQAFLAPGGREKIYMFDKGA